MGEQILVVPRPAIGDRLKQGFFTEESPAILATISAHATFIDRVQAEDDPSFKQVIPYVLVKHGGSHLAYRRTKKQGEARLHNKYSIGFGGHINPVDTSNPNKENVVLSGLVRELNEEVFIKAVGHIAFIGFINDETNPVGRVHLGVVFQLLALTPDFEVNEPGMIEAAWRSRAEIGEIADKLETWSRIIYECHVLA